MKWSGVTELPTLSSDAGQTFSVRGRGWTASDPGARIAADPSAWDGTLLALLATSGDRQYVFGTAFIIGPGIALTAAHVMREHYEAGHFDDLSESSLLGIGSKPDGSLVFWQVNHSATSSLDDDIAILAVEPRSKFESGSTIDVMPCSVISPKVGDVVSVAGFRATREVFDAGPALELAAVIGRGVVLDIFEEGRGSSYPTPCFAVDIPTVGGMSGGPVVNSEGRVLGVLSRGMGGEEGYSMVSLLRLAMASTFGGAWPPGWHRPNIELMKRLVQKLDGATRLVIEPGPSPDQRKVTYRRAHE
jgi:V8-like Glu-specific endopeptidase